LVVSTDLESIIRKALSWDEKEGFSEEYGDEREENPHAYEDAKDKLAEVLMVHRVPIGLALVLRSMTGWAVRQRQGVCLTNRPQG
jgi:hypothetical protein